MTKVAEAMSALKVSSSVLKSRAAWPTRVIRILRIGSPFLMSLSDPRLAVTLPIAVNFLSSAASFASVM